jgi:hypothetical protein
MHDMLTLSKIYAVKTWHPLAILSEPLIIANQGQSSAFLGENANWGGLVPSI